MRIFSNFDTKIKQKSYRENVDKYGQDNILYFGRSGLYFFIRIFFPFITILLISIGAIILFYYIFDAQYLLYFSVFVLVLSLFFLIPVVWRWIDYRMDFIIVTPDFLVMYNQTGIFAKKVITANSRSIKTVSVERSGILYSLFNNGDIVVLSEGDVFMLKEEDRVASEDGGSQSRGEIVLKRVYNPEQKRQDMMRLLRK